MSIFSCARTSQGSSRVDMHLFQFNLGFLEDGSRLFIIFWSVSVTTGIFGVLAKARAA